jgi:hypothetical protein
LMPLTALEPRVRGVLFFILQWSAALGKLNVCSILNWMFWLGSRIRHSPGFIRRMDLSQLLA